MLIQIVSAVIAGLMLAGILKVAPILLKGTWPWKERWNAKKLIISATILSGIVFVSDFTPVRIAETIRASLFPWSLPQSEKWTTEAWIALEEGRYEDAIELAMKVVDKFGAKAIREQTKLENLNVPTPPHQRVGPCDSLVILDRGVLNDVAASYWILGNSQEVFNNLCDAQDAYQKTVTLSYARILDPQWWPIRGWSPPGWFWIPAEEAQDRLLSINCSEAL